MRSLRQGRGIRSVKKKSILPPPQKNPKKGTFRNLDTIQRPNLQKVGTGKEEIWIKGDKTFFATKPQKKFP